MTHQSEMRDLLNQLMMVNRVYQITEIYGLVERLGNLDKEDWKPSGTKKEGKPRWKETVRTVLSEGKKWGQSSKPLYGYHKRLTEFKKGIGR